VGTEIVGGDRVPPAPIVNVAGIRGPLAGGGATTLLVAVRDVVVDDDVLVVVAIEVVVEGVLATVVEDAADETAAVAEVWFELPHPPSRRPARSPGSRTRRLTSTA
jgi:hypothetical protein